MKIGVISDTHIPIAAKQLPEKVYDYFRNCDFIIHAGDAIEMSVIDDLSRFAEVKAVHGNMDSPEMSRCFPEKISFVISGKRIGVVHGKGSSDKVWKTAEELLGKDFDIIIFGHSHVPFNETKDGILFFNPGSATDKVFSPYCSFGMIEINGNEIKAEIIKI
ncbi:MAG: metallophosphoesterase [Candidatus Omnitrophota bacterium]